MNRTGQVGCFDSWARRVGAAALHVAMPLLLAMAMAMATPVQAGASTFVVPGLDVLVAMSSAVVRGEVVDASSRRADNERIVTDYTVRVDEVAAGQAGSTVQFTLPGGTIGDDGEVVTGMPTFQTGDQVVLFLKTPDVTGTTGMAPSRFMVTGMAVGALRVEMALDGTPMVRGLAAGAFNRGLNPRLGASDGSDRSTAGVTDNNQAPLKEFLEAVRSAGRGVAR